MNRLLVTLGLLAPRALSACSNFAAEWDRRLHTRALDGFDGCWKGQWRSETSGHDGHLRAIVTRSGDSDYSIRYYALYGSKALPIPFEYTLDSVKVEREGDVFNVVWTIDMGLYRKYSYDGKSTGESYKSSNISEYDRGIFDLERTAAD